MQTSEDLFNLDTGTYQVVVTDFNNCKDSLIVSLDVNPDPTGLSGTVFSDLNFDGVKDITEGGISMIIVHVYEMSGAFVSADTTNGQGKWSVSGLVASKDYRVEFVDIPSMYEVSFGPDSQSPIQVATTGDCTVDLGLYNTENYCEPDPYIVTPCYVDGEYNGTFGSEPVLVKLRLSADGHDFDTAQYNPDYEVEAMAAHEDIGTVYGLAWQQNTGLYYASSFHKRYSDFGPNGPDAIYMLNLNGDIRGVIEFDALTAMTNSTGGDVHDWTVAANGHVYDLGTGDISFDAVGKRGFGDIEISEDMSTLYVVNLWDRKVYALDVSAGKADSISILNSWNAPDETASGDHRPFGLAWHDDKLWLGSVDENGLEAYVHSLNPGGVLWQLELTIPLNYDRQAFFGNADNPGAPAEWNVWQSTTSFTYYDQSGEIGFPQAMLSDIEFADNGDMIIGFRDRFGDQMSTSKYFDTSETEKKHGISSGDILKACNNSGTFVLETGLSGLCPGVGGMDNSGPGGYEFYHYDIFSLNPTWDPDTVDGGFHWETTQGGLMQIPGASYVVTTAMDPYSDFSAGILKLDNSTGGRLGVGIGETVYDSLEGGYTIYDAIDFDPDGYPSNSPFFGKANGLGDLEAACQSAITIGNYVWYDVNQNGIQDPGEPPLAEVEVLLYQDSILIGRDTTDTNGYYVFGGLTNQNVFDTSLLQALTYTEIRVPIASAQANDGSITDITMVTYPDTGLDTLDMVDSDGQMAGPTADAIIAFETDFMGTTDFSFDFGFMACPEILDSVLYVGCEGDGYSIMVGTSLYDEMNPTGMDTLINAFGCDSIITTILTFNPVYRDSTFYVGCSGDGFSIEKGGVTYNESNPSGVDTLLTGAGCDSIFVVNLTFNPEVVVEAGMLAQPICSNSPVNLGDLGASITGGTTEGTWTTTGTGTFDNGGDFGGPTPSTMYTLSQEDIDAGQVILTLTSDDPPGPCEPEADAALIIINDIRCSTFPFSGGN